MYFSLYNHRYFRFLDTITKLITETTRATIEIIKAAATIIFTLYVDFFE